MIYSFTMENTNNDLQREAYFKDKGNKYHRDGYGVWFINQKGWESIRIQDLSDQGLREKAETEIISTRNKDKSADRVNKFQIDDTQTCTIWINYENEDYGKSNLSRKSLIDPNDDSVFDENFDIESFKKEQAAKKQSTGGGGGYSKGDGSKKMTLYKDFVSMTLEDFNEANKKDWKRTMSPKHEPNTYFVSKNGEVTVMVITAEMYWKDNE